MMSSTESGTGGPKLHRLFIKFDPEVVAVVSILLGLFQVLLAVPLYYMDVGLPKLQFMLPLFIGFLICLCPMEMNAIETTDCFYFLLKFVTAGSFAFACEKSPSRQLLTGCAYTNMASLLAGLLALCMYSVSLHSVQGTAQPCTLPSIDLYAGAAQKCPGEYLEGFFRSVTVLLIVYDLGALILHSLLSLSALKGLRVGLCRMIN
ncbi:uncharacterized protein LOC120052899 isoform X1 [Salvelinus namaycush]|uniref:Uncharacterized protein LOC120052899 isoform X1 n=1 Tax=Salvelinus namaycush TaxID=8040 RepID=A0A8U1EM84_SALNM|nr:uncharacterized protein LOC120052899 isoform X1 [Salvelinus namaycush]XP_038856036.1 uncharacterized protein LOC120052899 isoform X1 [Salvelinus namaycush]